MAQRSFKTLAVALIILNGLGLLWIRHELLARGTGRARIMSALPTRDIAKADRLSLVFDEPIVASRSLNQRLDRQPFVISPPAAGHWTWSQPDRLDFMLDKPLAPGRVFKVRAAGDLESQIGRRIVGPTEFRYETGALEVTFCGFYSADKDGVSLQLIFNQPVSPKDLAKYLTLRRPDETNRPLTPRVGVDANLKTTILTRETTDRIIVRCPCPTSKQIEATIKAGLASPGSEMPLAVAFTRLVDIPASFTLMRAEAHAPSLGNPPRVGLEFSSPLNRRQQIPKVQVEPAVADLRSELDYRGGLSLNGSFQCGVPYKVTVGAEAQSENGQPLGHDQTASFQIPDYEPGISFAHESGILAPGGNLQLDLEAVNAANLDVAVTRVYQNNLVAHLRGDDKDATSRSLAAKTLPLQLERNKPAKLALELRKLMDGSPGVYGVSANIKERTWARASSTVAISDLGITRKRDRDGYLVWVTSLKTAQPVTGAEVAAITYSNQVLASAVTGPDGIARLPINDNHPDGQPWLITARLGDDLNYLTHDSHDWILEKADTGGRDYPVNYDVMMYTERGIYRPGQTIHLTGLVRDELGQVPPAFPLNITFERADGKTITQLNVTPDPQKQGFFQADFPTRDDCMPTAYTFSANVPGSTTTLGEIRTFVLDFAPVRMEVNARPTKDTYSANEVPTIDAQARYLFGKPASELPVSVSGEYRRVSFKSKSMPDFIFTDPDEGKEVTVKEIETQLDKEGKAAIEVPLPGRKPPTSTSPATSQPATANKTMTNNATATEPADDSEADEADADEDDSADTNNDTDSEETDTDTPDTGHEDSAKPTTLAGLWEGTFAVTVTELGSRSVSGHAAVRLNAVDRHIGLRLPGKLVPTGQPVPVRYVEMTNDDKPAKPASFHFVLHRVERDYGLKRVNHKIVWQMTEHLIKVAEGDVDPSKAEPNDRSFPITCPIPGFHRLSVTGIASGCMTRIEFHATNDLSADQVAATDNPEQLDIVLDQPTYSPGGEARILVKSPFPGTMLMTLETDRIVRQQVIPMTGHSAEIRWQIPASVRGGAFVTATVVRPLDPSRPQWQPRRAMGMARLLTDHKSQQLPVAIDTPAEILPAAKATVSVKSPSSTDPLRPAMLHLWAVDEGILLTTKYQTPNPLSHFFEPRRSAIVSADLFDELMPDYQRAASVTRIGGDGKYPESAEFSPEAGALRLKTSDVRSKAPVVVWRTVVPVGPDGLTRIDMDTPDFTGELRLMAVVVDGDRYGSAKQAMKLAAPLLVETGWPRFVAPGDRFAVPTKIFNSTGKTMKVDLEVTPTDGPIAVSQPRQPAIMVPASQPVTVWLDAEAKSIGQVAIQVRAAGTTQDGRNLVADSKSEFTVRPAAAYHSQSQLLQAKAGETVSLSVPKELIPGSVRATLGIDARPSVQLQPALEQLVQYPYGCVEQVTSQLYALLYLPDLLARNDESGERGKVVGRMIDAGIARLWSMQTESGGLALWSREMHPYLWGSTYVGTFLLQARRAGVTVDPQFTNGLVKYLQEALQDTAEGRGPRGMDDNMRAMLCHVLAGFDQPPQSWMARLTENASKLGMAGRADLAAAWIHAGRKDRAKAVLLDGTMDQIVTISTGGRLTSQVREQAVLLNVLMDLDPSHPWIPTLVQKLEAARQQGAWSTTLENASALAALARYQSFSKHEDTSFEGTVRVANAKETGFNHTKSLAMKIDQNGWPAQIVTHGKGDVYMSVVFEGLLPQDETKPFDRQLTVRRKWLNCDGKPLDVKTLKVGDLIHVEVELAAPSLKDSDEVENICVVDALPGGTEAEDPQLATSAVSSDDGLKDVAECRTEIRDDRVLLFAKAVKKPRVYRYAVRVTAAGTFVVPPIEASCMYDPRFGSLNGGGTITVRK